MERMQPCTARRRPNHAESGQAAPARHVSDLSRLIGLLALSVLSACAPNVQPTASAQEESPATPTSAAQAVRTPTIPAITTAPTRAPTPALDGTIQVNPDDAAIEVADVSFMADDAVLQGYLARPREGGPFPVVLVCHGQQGLNEHFRDIARRLAKAGYVALAVDLLSRQGGTDQISDQALAQAAIANTPLSQVVGDFQSALRYLQRLEGIQQDHVGMVGFDFGGTVTWHVATQTPTLRAAVIFSGSDPPLDRLSHSQAAILRLSGERAAARVQDLQVLEAAMRQRGTVFDEVVYPQASEGFHDETDAGYDAAAARDAWAKTLAWFQRYLKT